MPLPFNTSQRTVREIYPNVPPIKFHIPSAAMPIPEQLVGLELEMENVGRTVQATRLPNWTLHNDGSLRNGVEYVSDGPICGDVIPESVSALFTLLRKHTKNLSVLSSFRTSTHVHLDFTRTTPYSDRLPADSYNNAKQVVLLYYALEDNFFRVAGEQRRHSGYCFPFSYANHELIAFLASSGQVRSNRYYGCNFSALSKYGTLEFRHMPLLLNEDDVMRWVRTLMRLKRVAYQMCVGDKPDMDLLENNNGLRSAAAYIFSEYPAGSADIDLAGVRKKLDVLAARVYARTHNVTPEPVESAETAGGLLRAATLPRVDWDAMLRAAAPVPPRRNTGRTFTFADVGIGVPAPVPETAAEVSMRLEEALSSWDDVDSRDTDDLDDRDLA